MCSIRPSSHGLPGGLSQQAEPQDLIIAAAWELGAQPGVCGPAFSARSGRPGPGHELIWAGLPMRSLSGLGPQAPAQGCTRLPGRQRGLGQGGRGRFPGPRSSTVHVQSFVPLGGLAGPWCREERVSLGSSAERSLRRSKSWCPVFPGDAGTLGEDAGSSGARNAGRATNGLVCRSLNQLLHSGF